MKNSLFFAICLFFGMLQAQVSTVTIGSQSWMNYNLNAPKYNDGTPIPKITSAAEWVGLTTGAYCYYNFDSTNYAAKFGKLYNWYAVAGIWDEASKTDVSKRKKLGPTGFHVATKKDWDTLINTLGGLGDAGGRLKGTVTDQWDTPNNGASNSSKFTAKGGGYMGKSGNFYYNLRYGYWWTATSEYEVDRMANAYSNYLYSGSGSIYKSTSDKKMGLSVRCVKD
ncbi:MAG: fibrobacter succinogenes major paralogous domain-containing protein [Saprospiraceae bacterium]|jgi:uncharacterized protein (TIGR02145 family)